jgi:hypothetical protein
MRVCLSWSLFLAAEPHVPSPRAYTNSPKSRSSVMSTRPSLSERTLDPIPGDQNHTHGNLAHGESGREACRHQGSSPA